MMLHKPYCRVALITLLLTVLLFTSVCTGFAMRVDPALLSPEGVGSVTVTVLTSGGEIIPGGTLRSYYVASLNAEGYYALTPAFAGCGLDLTQTYYAEDDVDLVLKHVAANAPASTEAPANEKGVAAFPNLPQGIYLITQGETPAGYLPILPFLVFVPTFSEGKAEYNVACSPKPVDLAPDLTLPFVVQKDVLCRQGVSAPSDTPFSFILTPDKPGQPMPTGGAAAPNAVTGALTVTRKGAGAVDFGKFRFSREDVNKTFTYRLREVKGNALYYTYDTSVFVIRLHLYFDEEKQLSCGMDITDENGKAYTEIIFTNEYNNEPPPDVPRTGQLWWPVFVLAGAGALLVTAGLVRRKREEGSV